MKYLCLVYLDEGFVPGTDQVADYLKTHRAMVEAGVYVASGALQPPTATTTVRVRGDESLLTDGPFAEIKEQAGGFFLLECSDLDEAVKWASMIPGAQADGAVEVRPLIDFGRFG